MARWRLTGKHYLKVPGTEWEREEVNVQTQKPMRKRYPVGLFLNPDDVSDCNYPGEIIVAYADSAQGRDIIFEGPPTPDMEPLDPEAAEISDRLRPTWIHPIESLDGGFSGALLNNLQQQIMDIQNRPQPTVSAGGISRSDFDELKKMVTSLNDQNAALQAELEAMRSNE